MTSAVLKILSITSKQLGKRLSQGQCHNPVLTELRDAELDNSEGDHIATDVPLKL